MQGLQTGVNKRPIYRPRELAEPTRELIGNGMKGQLFWDRDGEIWTSGTLRLPQSRLRKGDFEIRLVV